jgi:hypothetical protein
LELLKSTAGSLKTEEASFQLLDNLGKIPLKSPFPRRSGESEYEMRVFLSEVQTGLYPNGGLESAITSVLCRIGFDPEVAPNVEIILPCSNIVAGPAW